MNRCPRCDLMLTPLEAGAHHVEGCDECGGVWVAAPALAGLAKDSPQLLGSLDRQFNPSGARSLRVGRQPVCAECGEALVERKFPVAPELPLLACGKCKRIWLQDGQCQQLMATVAPALAAPPWEAPAEEADDDDEAEAVGGLRTPRHTERADRGYGPGGFWPERIPGQPWAAWFVCGMPLWTALLLMVVGGIVLSIVLAASPGSRELAFLGLPLMLLVWPTRAVILTIVLQITWLFTDDNPGLSFGETFSLLLRVVAVSETLTLLAGTLGTAAAGDLGCAVLQFGVALLIYRGVMEMEWRDIIIMGVVSSVLGLGGVSAIGGG